MPADFCLKRLRESTSYFGHNPRRCFQASEFADTLEFTKRDAASVIQSAAEETRDNITKLLHDTHVGDNIISHMIFQIFPTNTNAYRLLSECHFEPISRWALDIFMSEYEAHKADEIAEGFSDACGRVVPRPFVCKAGR